MYTKDIFLDDSYKLYNKNTKFENGEYDTIRVGLGGHIYHHADIVIDGKFQIGIADGSRIILYKKQKYDKSFYKKN